LNLGESKGEEQKQYIGSIEDAPYFAKDNDFIHHGYRIGFYDIKSVLRTLFMCHNETANVWSHLLGVFLFIGLIIWIVNSLGHGIYHPRYEVADKFEFHGTDVLYQKCKNYNLELLTKINVNKAKWMAYNEIYHSAIEHWHQEVEQNGFEYFTHNSWIQQNLDERKAEENNNTFNRLMLLERDPYTEITKLIEYYCHTEAESIQYLMGKFDLDPENVIQTVKAISHYVQEQIDEQLEVWEQIEPSFTNVLEFNYEVQLIRDMKEAYKVIKSVVNRHLGEFTKRIAHSFQASQIGFLFEDDEISENIEDHETVSQISIIPLILHMLAAIIWFSLSSIFHLFTCHSEEAHTFLSRLDYGGIVILIGGSTIPPYIYGFYCGKLWYFGVFYTIAWDTMCLAAFIWSLIPTFDQPKYRNVRATLFVLVGLTSGLPGVHAVFFRDPFVIPPMNVFYWALGGAVYVSGAFIYAFRFPERYFEGKFSYFGHSHNIWHWFVLAGAMIHFYASLNDYYVRRTFPWPLN
jgi:channel protein (hemolysin III family)